MGWLVGLLVYRMLRSVDHYQVEILLSLALVAGGYAGADALHLSGPIAMVVAGLHRQSRPDLRHVGDDYRTPEDVFWELVDEILNAVLFVLIGLEVLVLTSATDLIAGLLAIVIVLAARVASVGLPMWALRRWDRWARRWCRS